MSEPKLALKALEGLKLLLERNQVDSVSGFRAFQQNEALDLSREDFLDSAEKYLGDVVESDCFLPLWNYAVGARSTKMPLRKWTEMLREEFLNSLKALSDDGAGVWGDDPGIEMDLASTPAFQIEEQWAASPRGAKGEKLFLEFKFELRRKRIDARSSFDAFRGSGENVTRKSFLEQLRLLLPHCSEIDENFLWYRLDQKARNEVDWNGWLGVMTECSEEETLELIWAALQFNGIRDSFSHLRSTASPSSDDLQKADFVQGAIKILSGLVTETELSAAWKLLDPHGRGSLSREIWEEKMGQAAIGGRTFLELHSKLGSSIDQESDGETLTRRLGTDSILVTPRDEQTPTPNLDPSLGCKNADLLSAAIAVAGMTLEEAFVDFDRSGNQRMSAADFIGRIPNFVGRSLSSVEILELHAWLDTDGDGFVDRAEWGAGLKQLIGDGANLARIMQVLGLETEEVLSPVVTSEISFPLPQRREMDSSRPAPERNNVITQQEAFAITETPTQQEAFAFTATPPVDQRDTRAFSVASSDRSHEARTPSPDITEAKVSVVDSSSQTPTGSVSYLIPDDKLINSRPVNVESTSPAVPPMRKRAFYLPSARLLKMTQTEKTNLQAAARKLVA